MEKNIRRHDFKHEDDAMQTIWRIAYGEMMSSMRRVHQNHVENSIWRHDVKNEENAMQTMWRTQHMEL